MRIRLLVSDQGQALREIILIASMLWSIGRCFRLVRVAHLVAVERYQIEMDMHADGKFPFRWKGNHGPSLLVAP